MKNTENAAMPMSAMTYWLFFPRRLSGRPAQVCRNPDMRSSSVPTRSLNQTRPDPQTTQMNPDSICHTPLHHAPRQNENCCSAADGLDSTCHPAIVCHQEFDGKARLKCNASAHAQAASFRSAVVFGSSLH